MDATRKKKRSPFKLKKMDLKVLFSFFESSPVDYPALQAMIEKRFAEAPVLRKMCESFASTMQTIDAGKPLVIDMQSMVAKSVLNLIINLGRISAARMFLAACKEKFWDSNTLEIDSILTLAESDIERLAIIDKPWLDYQIHDRGADTTIIMMCGNSHRFGVELNAVAIWLEPLPVNIIYLRDFNFCLYLAGVRSIGNMEESVARIRQDLDALGTKRVIVAGSSAGVFGALNYGYRLKADQVLCFAGPTSLNAGKLEASERPSYIRIQEMIDEGVIEEPDMRTAYQESGIRVRYFYGAEYEFDQVQVQTLEGLPNVTIEPLVDWPRHIVIAEMARRNLLKGVFANAVSGKN
jgi:hypothetical protein